MDTNPAARGRVGMMWLVWLTVGATLGLIVASIMVAAADH
jgi:hypothetical protein